MQGIKRERVSLQILRENYLLYPESRKPQRPKTRGECPEIRPCPYVGCVHNLYIISVNQDTVAYRECEPWDMPPNKSCSLDIADEGEHTIEEIAEITGVSKQRASQIVLEGLQSFKGVDSDDMDDIQEVLL